MVENNTNGAEAPEAIAETQPVQTQPLRRLKPTIIKPVPIDFGEVNADGSPRIRHLTMTMKTMNLIWQKTGLAMWRGEAWDFESQPPDTFTTILWAAMLDDDPTLTQDDVEGLPGFSLSNIPYISQRLGELMGIVFPDEEEETTKSETTDGEPDPNLKRAPGRTGGATRE